MTAVNAQDYIAAPDSISVHITTHQRRRMFGAFLAATRIGSSDTVLDVGMTRDRGDEHSNYFEAWYPHKSRITTAGLYDAFDDGSFDYVHSCAVLEHVGDRASQAEFVRQAWRVARKGIFIATPNRWFPIEFHTELPLVHWLPPAQFRTTLRRLGRDSFASEENLNLLSASDLLRVARVAGIPDSTIWRVSMCLWTTNLILVALRH